MLHLPCIILPRVIFNFDGTTILCEKKEFSKSLYLGYSSCLLGDSSLWMNGIAATGMNEVCIGPLPFAYSGCLFYCGQKCRRLSQRLSCTGSGPGVDLVLELFGLSECTVSAPAFTPSLLSFILDSASASLTNAAMKRSSLLPNLNVSNPLIFFTWM